MTLPRRRLLTGTAGIASLLAGCGGRSDSRDTATVTPVGIPRTDEELLADAASIDSPSVPPAAIVTDGHLAAGLEQAAAALSAVEDGREALDRTDAVDHPEPYRGDVDAVLERTENRIASARRSVPAERPLESARSAVRTIAPLYGYVRATVDGVEPADLRAEIETERRRREQLRDEFRYGVAAPIGEHLPTLYAAEDALADSPGFERELELLEESDADDERYPSVAAEVQQRLEWIRRKRDDSEWFLEAATDAGAPSIGAAVAEQFEEARGELARIASEYDVADRTRSDRSSPEETIREARVDAAVRSRTVRFSAVEKFEAGWRVTPLLDAVEGIVTFDAADAAVDATLERLEDDRFPAEHVVAEKRRAVESLEPVAEGGALGRHLALGSTSAIHGPTGAPSKLLAGDRFAEREETDVMAVSRAHYLYAEAAAWADLARRRASRLSSSLQA